MKTCFIMKQGSVPALHDVLLAKITPDNVFETLEQYQLFQAPLALVVAPQVPESALLKFVEESFCELFVIVYYTPGLVFLSRFGRVVSMRKPEIKPYPNKTSSQVLFDECRQLVTA